MHSMPLIRLASSTATSRLQISSEQVSGRDLDCRSDLFSFGVVLYEMVTGELPFRGNTIGLVSDAILNRGPVSPKVINPRTTLELQQVINKALEKDRTLRYQQASEIRADLTRMRRGTGLTLAKPTSSVEFDRVLQATHRIRLNSRPTIREHGT